MLVGRPRAVLRSPTAAAPRACGASAPASRRGNEPQLSKLGSRPAGIDRGLPGRRHRTFSGTNALLGFGQPRTRHVETRHDLQARGQQLLSTVVDAATAGGCIGQ